YKLNKLQLADYCDEWQEYKLPKNEKYYKLINFIAKIIQNAHLRCNNIIYMYSSKGGVGKSFLVEILEQLTEPYFRLIVDTENMVKWNANISRKTLVCINEHQNNVENSNYIEHLKSLSTDNKIETRQKYKIDQIEDNCVNFIILSNHLNGVIMSE